MYLNDDINTNVQGLDAGVYVVGTGGTGVAETFVTMGLLYGSIMAIAASQHRVAPE